MSSARVETGKERAGEGEVMGNLARGRDERDKKLEERERYKWKADRKGTDSG